MKRSFFIISFVLLVLIFSITAFADSPPDLIALDSMLSDEFLPPVAPSSLPTDSSSIPNVDPPNSEVIPDTDGSPSSLPSGYSNVILDAVPSPDTGTSLDDVSSSLVTVGLDSVIERLDRIVACFDFLFGVLLPFALGSLIIYFCIRWFSRTFVHM